jgi:hypothetical protein
VNDHAWCTSGAAVDTNLVSGHCIDARRCKSDTSRPLRPNHYTLAGHCCAKRAAVSLMKAEVCHTGAEPGSALDSSGQALVEPRDLPNAWLPHQNTIATRVGAGSRAVRASWGARFAWAMLATSLEGDQALELPAMGGQRAQPSSMLRATVALTFLANQTSLERVFSMAMLCVGVGRVAVAFHDEKNPTDAEWSAWVTLCTALHVAHGEAPPIPRAQPDRVPRRASGADAN